MTVATYPVAAPTAGTTLKPRLRTHHFLMAVVGILGLIVVGVTVGAVVSRPTPTTCHFTCGPDVGRQYLSPTAYTSSAFGYRVQYNAKQFTTSNVSRSGVQLNTRDGSGILIVSSSAGSDVQSALQTSIDKLNSNVIQDVQAVGQLPGAEIGEVQGVGWAYTGTFVPPNGGQSIPVSVMDVAASHDGVTIGVLAVGPQSLSSVSDLPFGMANAQELDQPMTNTLWASRP